MENLNKRAVIYTRTTTGGEASFYLSQDTQTELCREFADEREWQVEHMLHDYSQSGLEHNRPALTELLQYIATEANIIVLVASEDRLAKNPLVRASIRFAIELLGAEIIDVSAETLEARRVAA